MLPHYSFTDLIMLKRNWTEVVPPSVTHVFLLVKSICNGLSCQKSVTLHSVSMHL